MPAALDKSGTYRVVLECDRKLPEPKQPFFLFRRLTGREFRGILTMSDKLTGGDPVKHLDEVYDMVRSSLVNWGNMVGPDGVKIPYKPKDLDTITNLDDVRELVGGIMDGNQLETDQKKAPRRRRRSVRKGLS